MTQPSPNVRLGGNDLLRLLLELLALAGWWMLGLSLSSGAWRWLLAVVLTAGAAVVWAVFRVPGDPGDAPVPVSGQARLGVEAVIFLVATIGIGRQMGAVAAVVFAAVTVVHYLFAYERVVRLIRS